MKYRDTIANELQEFQDSVTGNITHHLSYEEHLVENNIVEEFL